MKCGQGTPTGLDGTGSLTAMVMAMHFGMDMRPGIPPRLNSGPQSGNHEAAAAPRIILAWYRTGRRREIWVRATFVGPVHPESGVWSIRQRRHPRVAQNALASRSGEAIVGRAPAGATINNSLPHSRQRGHGEGAAIQHGIPA
jgi:hypothetical protein